MCQYCEGEFDTYIDPEYEQSGITIRAYLQEYDTAGWTLTTSNGDEVIEVGVSHCPWCGRELD